jgi:hypothetical protein
MEELNCHRAAKLFAALPHFFRAGHVRWPEWTAAGLARVEALLAQPRTTVTVPAKVESPETALARVLDARTVEPLLQEILPREESGVAKVRVTSAVLRRHKPGRRALIEYDLSLAGADGRSRTVTWLGKWRARGVDEKNLALLKALAAGGFSATSPDGISVAAPRGILPGLGLWLQSKVTGTSMAAWLTGVRSSEAATRAALAVTKLHRSYIQPTKTHLMSDELRILQERLAAVSEARPEWRPRLQRLLHACAVLAAQVPSVEPRPIHRDFYHDQLWCDAHRTWLLDLDLLCLGDPALDAGNFIGHLLEWAVRAPELAPGLHAAAEVFAERFLALSPGCSRGALEAYTTLTLVRHVSLSRQFPERAPFTERILELCERRCLGVLRLEPPVVFA